MESKFQLTLNGQQVIVDDFNLLGETSGLADDRVIAELFRMTPYNGSAANKGILPYGHAASGSNALVQPNGASGQVKVNPFRALIGSRTAVATDAKKNWRDIRSGICVGTTTLYQTISIAANSSGNPRWDLVYAVVAVDANGASVTRKVKDPTTKVITSTSVTTYLQTNVTLGIVTGTPGATPAFPSAPSDSGSSYYISLAYVRVPDGFNGTATVTNKDIDEVAPMLVLSKTVGSCTTRPADQMNAVGGTALSSTGASPIGSSPPYKWTGTADSRPALYMPPAMMGGESIIIAIDALDASTVNWSHQTDSVVDASRDWRNRLFKWHAVYQNSTGPDARWNWNLAPSSGTVGFPTVANLNTGAVNVGSSGIGQTIGVGASFSATYTANKATVVLMAQTTNAPQIATGTFFYIYCDMTTGELKFTTTGLVGRSFFIWLDASAPFTGY